MLGCYSSLQPKASVVIMSYHVEKLLAELTDSLTPMPLSLCFNLILASVASAKAYAGMICKLCY